MTHPLFQVNEEVDLVSSTHPQENGVYTIIKVVYIAEPVIANGGYQCPVGWYYMLHHDTENFFYELALRKRYRPSNQSYSELIESLKEIKPHHWLEDIKTEIKRGGFEDE